MSRIVLEVFKKFLNMPTFGEKLSILLKSRNMTQEEAGKEFGVSQRAVSGWLSGSIPRKHILEELSRKFRIPLEVLTDNTIGLPPEYQVYSSTSGLTVEKILGYFDSFPADAVLEVISQAIANGDTDIANTLIQRLKNRTNDKA